MSEHQEESPAPAAESEPPPATAAEDNGSSSTRIRAQIRGIGLRDLDGIQALYEKLNAHLSQSDPITSLGENLTFAAFSLKKLRQQLLMDQNYHGAVAVSEAGDVLGYCTGSMTVSGALFKVQQHGTITELYVDEPYRNNGLGKRLLKHVIERFNTLGLQHVEISGPPGIEAPDSFLSKLGFKPASTRMILEARQPRAAGEGTSPAPTSDESSP